MTDFFQVFPSSEIFFQTFYSNAFWQECLQEAQEQFPKFKTGGADTRQAASMIVDKMSEFLYAYDPVLNEMDIEAFMDTNTEELKRLTMQHLI